MGLAYLEKNTYFYLGVKIHLLSVFSMEHKHSLRGYYVTDSVS